MKILNQLLYEILDFLTTFITIQTKIKIFNWLYKKGNKNAAVVLATIYIWNVDIDPDFNLAKKYLLEAQEYGIKKASIYIEILKKGDNMWDREDNNETLKEYRKIKKIFKGLPK